MSASRACSGHADRVADHQRRAGMTPSAPPVRATGTKARARPAPATAHARRAKAVPGPTRPDAPPMNGPQPAPRRALHPPARRRSRRRIAPFWPQARAGSRPGDAPNRHSHASGNKRKIGYPCAGTIPARTAPPRAPPRPAQDAAAPTAAPAPRPATAPVTVAPTETRQGKEPQSAAPCAAASAGTARPNRYRSRPCAPAADRWPEPPDPCCLARYRTKPAPRNRYASVAPRSLHRHASHIVRPPPWARASADNPTAPPAPRLPCDKARDSVAGGSDHIRGYKRRACAEPSNWPNCPTSRLWRALAKV